MVIKQTSGSLTTNEIKKLSRIYHDITHASGFSSALKLHRATKIPLHKIKHWLQSQETYTLHKRAIRKFKRNRYVVHNPLVCFEIDLCDMQKYSSENDQNKYLLCCIDVFSKMAWVEPLIDKKCSTITRALEKIFKKSGIPLKIRSDRGCEFTGSEAQALFKKFKIIHSTTENSDIKCSIVERFNLTIKTKILKYFSHYGKQRYIHILQQVVDGYNNSTHSAIKMKPNDVNIDNASIVWDNLYGGKGRYEKIDLFPKLQDQMLKPGDHVRISKVKGVFCKGYESNWSREIFIIDKVIHRTPTVYKLVDLLHESVSGVFYEAELQKLVVGQDDVFKIEQILQTSGKGLNKRLFVKWLGYDSRFNSWISQKDLINI